MGTVSCRRLWPLRSLPKMRGASTSPLGGCGPRHKCADRLLVRRGRRVTGTIGMKIPITHYALIIGGGVEMNSPFVSLRRAAGICLAILLFLVCTARAQRGTSGSIEGTITDVQRGAISGAKLSAVNSDTGLKFESASDESGFFHFPVVPPGTYVVTAEKSGFSSYAVRVSVPVGTTIDLPIQLKVGTQATSVTVTAEVPIVELTRSSVQSSVGELAVSDLPTLGRNSLIVDGSDNNNTFFGQTLGRTGSGRAPYQFSQDAVQEFQVNSNAYSAEYGRAGGAVINVVTKSGTNTRHGSLFDFYRDKALNANDPINVLNNRAK